MVKVKSSFDTVGWSDHEFASKAKPELQIHSSCMEQKYTTGDMIGDSYSHFAMTSDCGENADKYAPCNWAGVDVFTGTIKGKTGTVRFTTWGTYADKKVEANMVADPKSATGELKGMEATGKYHVNDGQCKGIEVELDVKFA